jgi:hypothetical protein
MKPIYLTGVVCPEACACNASTLSDRSTDMTPIEDKSKHSDGPVKGGYADVAQPKPEIPDVIPHQPEIDHTNNNPDGDRSKPGQRPAPPVKDDKSKDGSQRQGGGAGQQKQHQNPTPSRS